MLKNILYIVLIIAIVAIVILIGRNWNKIMAFFSKSSYQKCVDKNKSLPDGSDCKLCIQPGSSEIYEKSIIKNGVCVVDENPPPAAQDELQVSNPNGAIMYYQSDTQSGGKMYSPSNIVIPSGTKIKMVKVWQTNLSTQAFGGYYETNYKQYGPLSGFFDIKDMKKEI